MNIERYNTHTSNETSVDLNLFEKDPIGEMRRINPNSDPLFTAIDKLTTPEQILKFCEKYKADVAIRVTEEEIKAFGSVEAIVYSNIAFRLSESGQGKADTWSQAIGNTEPLHPFFGSPSGITIYGVKD